ncbi:uncharacterized protein LOC131856870 [Cryptomeria japonica]|uniref:uncharacterized protein LOC131856870 n=1 Tax=Cryptomeria japonica TaxID=3369 RepID=UPI0027DA0F8D|nr:uncharacterized protein LOC131856870 [Cryptomeria japonica]
MESYISSLGFDIWQSIVIGYTPPTNSPYTPDEKKKYESNAKAKNGILCGQSNSEFVKVIQCKTAKDIWDKLHSIYEGDDIVKQAKLHTFKAWFEGLKMKEEEQIAEYLLIVDEVVNAIKELSEEIKDVVIMKKVLRSLPSKYDSKLFDIEEYKDLDKISMDELFGSLFAYEMRIGKGRNQKSLYSKEDGGTSDVESDVEDVTELGSEDYLFMAIVVIETEKNDNESIRSGEEEVEVNLEGELIFALNELDHEREKNHKYKRNIEESEALVINLITKIEESKKIEDALIEKLQDKEKERELLEVGILCLRKYDKCIEALDNMLSKQ